MRAPAAPVCLGLRGFPGPRTYRTKTWAVSGTPRVSPQLSEPRVGVSWHHAQAWRSCTWCDKQGVLSIYPGPTGAPEDRADLGGSGPRAAHTQALVLTGEDGAQLASGSCSALAANALGESCLRQGRRCRPCSPDTAKLTVSAPRVGTGHSDPISLPQAYS